MQFPPYFKLRSGPGGPNNGLCAMQMVAVLSGERISDKPECACPILTAYTIGLNDAMPDDMRQELLPLAPLLVGTRSPEHEAARLKILGLAACRAARAVAHLNADPRVMAAIETAKAARSAWAAARSAWAAARAAGADAGGAIFTGAITALRDAIDAGPNGGLDEAQAQERLDAWLAA